MTMTRNGKGIQLDRGYGMLDTRVADVILCAFYVRVLLRVFPLLLASRIGSCASPALCTWGLLYMNQGLFTFLVIRRYQFVYYGFVPRQHFDLMYPPPLWSAALASPQR